MESLFSAINRDYFKTGIMNKVFFCFLFVCFLMSAQNKEYSNTFTDEILLSCPVCKKGLPGHTNNDFHKAHTFFANQMIDSSYNYVNKLIVEKTIENALSQYIIFTLKGRILIKKQLYDAAEKSIKEAILLGETNNFLSKVNLYSILGQVYLEKKEYKNGIYYLEKWKKGYDDTNVNTGINFHNLGLCHLHMGHYNKAESNLFKSYDINGRFKDTAGLARSSLDIGNLYYEQYKDKQAIYYFKKGLDYAKNSNDLNVLQNAYLNLSVVEDNRNNYAEALMYRKEYEKVKDSIWNRDKIWLIAQKDKEISILAKKKEIETLQLNALLKDDKLKTQTWQKKLFIILSCLLFVIVLLIMYYNSKIIKQRNVIGSQKDHLQKLNRTKDQLFSVISHDLRSPVHLLNHKLQTALGKQDHSLKKETKLILDSYELSKRISLLIDNTLHWILQNKDQLIFRKEPLKLSSVINQVVYNYTPIINDKNIQLTYKIDSDVPVDADLNSIKIIIRNILDNAIKFSFKDGKISISIEYTDKLCNVIIKDEGIGYETETSGYPQILKNKGTGLGLNLCKDLLAKNNGFLHITGYKNKGTKVIITLKRHEYEFPENKSIAS